MRNKSTPKFTRATIYTLISATAKIPIITIRLIISFLIALIFSPVLLLFEDGNEVGELLFLDYEPEHRKTSDTRYCNRANRDTRNRAARKSRLFGLLAAGLFAAKSLYGRVFLESADGAFALLFAGNSHLGFNGDRPIPERVRPFIEFLTATRAVVPMFGCVKVSFCIRGVRVVSESGCDDISADGAFDGFGFGGFGAVGRVGSDVNFSAARAFVPMSCAVRFPGCRSCGVQLEVGLYRHVCRGHGKVG